LNTSLRSANMGSRVHSEGCTEDKEGAKSSFEQ
jgi:hypothetical protein